ncbi:MAG: ABC transporter permease [Caldisphaera sp.]
MWWIKYFLPRLLQFFIVVFVGITLVFIIPRLVTSNNPVQQVINNINTQGAFMSPSAVAQLRNSLEELYGLKGSMLTQYLDLWGRLFHGNFGPSLSAFPTPVIKLIETALPWTIFLVVLTVVISWIIGLIAGGIAAFLPMHLGTKIMERLALILWPIPYYVFALIVLIMFGVIIPIFPLSGGYSMTVNIGLNWNFITSALYYAFLPALSLILLGIAGWFISTRLIASNIVSEDYVIYAETGGVSRSKIIFKYIIRNALLPQATGLALSLGQSLSGVLITEIVFSYPGVGTLLYHAIVSNDYNLIMGITALSIIGIAVGVLIMDLLYPLIDPRIRYS